jgi:8-oxo-dGTP pyrophosphatase MutT (NUDIX family)
MWIQPGGHIDPEDTDFVSAAKRELIEETGLSDCEYCPANKANLQMPIRIVLNPIPTNPKKNETEHIHIDLAYIFVTNQTEIKIDSIESNQFKWVSFQEFANDPRFCEIAQKMQQLKLA